VSKNEVLRGQDPPRRVVSGRPAHLSSLNAPSGPRFAPGHT